MPREASKGGGTPARARGVAHDRVVSRRLKELIPALVLVAVVVYLFILMW